MHLFHHTFSCYYSKRVSRPCHCGCGTSVRLISFVEQHLSPVQWLPTDGGRCCCSPKPAGSRKMATLITLQRHNILSTETNPQLFEEAEVGICLFRFKYLVLLACLPEFTAPVKGDRIHSHTYLAAALLVGRLDLL